MGIDRVPTTGTWFDDEEHTENPVSSKVELNLGYGDDSLYIDGLGSNGQYLCVPLSAVAKAIATGAKQD